MPVKQVTPSAGLLQLAKLVAADLRRGVVSAGLGTIGAALAQNPDTVLLVLRRARNVRAVICVPL
jgi:hypothetical protein